MAQISKRVRDLIRGRLASTWTLKLAMSQHSYQCSPADKDALNKIDWLGATKQQVFAGDIDPDVLDETITAAKPICTVWTESADEDGDSKFKLFSGTVTAYVRIYWEGLKPEAFQEVLDLAEDAFVECFKDHDWLGGLQVVTMAPRGVSLSRTGVQGEAGKNWRQSITVRLTMGVDL